MITGTARGEASTHDDDERRAAWRAWSGICLGCKRKGCRKDLPDCPSGGRFHAEVPQIIRDTIGGGKKYGGTSRSPGRKNGGGGAQRAGGKNECYQFARTGYCSRGG